MGPLHSLGFGFDRLKLASVSQLLKKFLSLLVVRICTKLCKVKLFHLGEVEKHLMKWSFDYINEREIAKVDPGMFPNWITYFLIFKSADAGAYLGGCN